MAQSEISYLPLLSLFAALAGSCAVLLHYLKPADLKRSSKQWAMPPGPSGLPVLGNLLQMMRARRGAIPFNNWVSFQPC